MSSSPKLARVQAFEYQEPGSVEAATAKRSAAESRRDRSQRIRNARHVGRHWN